MYYVEPVCIAMLAGTAFCHMACITALYNAFRFYGELMLVRPIWVMWNLNDLC